MGGSRRWSVGGLALGAVGLLLGGCSGGATVPMPPNDADPETVVRAYTSALHAEDCETAHALRVEGRGGWCGNVVVSNVAITSVGPDGCCGMSQSYADSRRVEVELDTRGGDISLPDGRHLWGYVLVRDDPTKPWRILDEGMG